MKRIRDSFLSCFLLGKKKNRKYWYFSSFCFFGLPLSLRSFPPQFEGDFPCGGEPPRHAFGVPPLQGGVPVGRGGKRFVKFRQSAVGGADHPLPQLLLNKSSCSLLGGGATDTGALVKQKKSGKTGKSLSRFIVVVKRTAHRRSRRHLRSCLASVAQLLFCFLSISANASFLESPILPILSILIIFTIISSPSLQTSSTFSTRRFSNSEM